MLSQKLAELRIGGSSSVRYDPNTGQIHHHLVCERCGLIFDVHPAGVDGLTLPRHERFGADLPMDALTGASVDRTSAAH